MTAVALSVVQAVRQRQAVLLAELAELEAFLKVHDRYQLVPDGPSEDLPAPAQVPKAYRKTKEEIDAEREAAQQNRADRLHEMVENAEPEPMPARKPTWPEQEAELRRLVAEGKKNREIGEALGRSEGAVSVYRTKIGLVRKNADRPKDVTGHIPPARNLVSAEQGRASKDPKAKRRFTEMPGLDPTNVKALPDDHEALKQQRTLFPSTVVDPKHSPRVLVSGENSRKLGSHVTKGPWKGMPIYQLTLEERKTCPISCDHWATCYGNGLQLARRHAHGPELERLLEIELRRLQHQWPNGFVVRLHNLGDFYSVAYVELWNDWLMDFPALRVFGYTHWPTSAPIGRRIEAMRDAHWDRFAVRTSAGVPLATGATTIDRIPDSPRVKEGIVCPAQLKRTDCCGTCGLCWHPNAKNETIVFVLHGNTKPGRKPGQRKCLGCQRPFDPDDKGNFMCTACTSSNRGRGLPQSLLGAP